MKMITKDTDYAIRAVVYLAKVKDRFVSSSEIAKKEKIPLLYLRRILQVLIRNNLAVSKEGIGGGVRLKVKPENINIADMIGMIQGQIKISKCMFRKKMCANRKNCMLRKKIQSVEELVIQKFRNVTIQDLLS